MRATEIIGQIPWAPETDPAVKQLLEDAILALDRTPNRKLYNDLEPHVRLEKFVKRHGTGNKAAEALGISKSFLHDVRHGHRPMPDSILAALGLEMVRGARQYRDR